MWFSLTGHPQIYDPHCINEYGGGAGACTNEYLVPRRHTAFSQPHPGDSDFGSQQSSELAREKAKERKSCLYRPHLAAVTYILILAARQERMEYSRLNT
jgi:hypothetical protein